MEQIHLDQQSRPVIGQPQDYFEVANLINIGLPRMLFNLVPPLVDLTTQHIRVISAANDDRWLVYRKNAEKTTSWTPSLLA